jgi:hypothetical protein
MLSRKLDSTNDGEHGKSARPTVWEKSGHRIGNAAVLEMPRQDRKAHQQQKEIGEDHPFVVQLQDEAGEDLALPEARKQELVKCNGHEPGHRHLKCLVVEHRYTEQRQAEQNEINRDIEQVDGLC